MTSVTANVIPGRKSTAPSIIGTTHVTRLLPLYSSCGVSTWEVVMMTTVKSIVPIIQLGTRGERLANSKTLNSATPNTSNVATTEMPSLSITDIFKQLQLSIRNE